MKTIVYTGALGPRTVTAGAAGVFEAGIPRQIEDDAIAAQLLAKAGFEAVATAKSAPAETTKEG